MQAHIEKLNKIYVLIIGLLNSDSAADLFATAHTVSATRKVIALGTSKYLHWLIGCNQCELYINILKLEQVSL